MGFTFGCSLSNRLIWLIQLIPAMPPYRHNKIHKHLPYFKYADVVAGLCYSCATIPSRKRWVCVCFLRGRHESKQNNCSRVSRRDGWLDKWLAGWMDGWRAGWMDRWMDCNTTASHSIQCRCGSFLVCNKKQPQVGLWARTVMSSIYKLFHFIYLSNSWTWYFKIPTIFNWYGVSFSENS